MTDISGPSTREACRARLAELKDDVAAIRAQIAAADMDRQSRNGKPDPRWFHRAKTALRHKQREIEALAARLAEMSARRSEEFKDCLIEVVREDYGDDEWREVMDEAHRRHSGREDT